MKTINIFYKPKLGSVIWLILFSVLLFSSYTTLLLLPQTEFSKYIDMLAWVYFIIFISSSSLFIMFFNYVIICIETIVKNLNKHIIKKVFIVLSVIEIFLGITLILFSIYSVEASLIFSVETSLFEKFYHFSSNTSLIKNALNFPLTNEDFVNLIQIFFMTVLFSMLILGITLFYTAKRKIKTIKLINKTISHEKKQHDIDTKIGFEYCTSEYFLQTQIPFISLSQTDGTLGEFEAFKQLKNSDITGLEFIFNREIPKSDGLNTEIDLIVLHKNGIAVIENKYYTTKIYGKANDNELTIINNKGHKQIIYNPIKQNEHHISVLKEYLTSVGLFSEKMPIPIFSFVVFTDLSNSNSDKIIEGIDMTNNNTILCTSQNLAYMFKKTFDNVSQIEYIRVSSIKDHLLSLNIRKKY